MRLADDETFRRVLSVLLVSILFFLLFLLSGSGSVRRLLFVFEFFESSFAFILFSYSKISSGQPKFSSGSHVFSDL